MADTDVLAWPSSEPRHRDGAAGVHAWAVAQAARPADERDADGSAPRPVRAMEGASEIQRIVVARAELAWVRA